jgi:hypothetical protein
VHKKVVAACVLTPGAAGQPPKELRTVGTMTDDLERLADWLAERGVAAVAMESTGSSWKPIWNILEERGFALVLANPTACSWTCCRPVVRLPAEETG